MFYHYLFFVSFACFAAKKYGPQEAQNAQEMFTKIKSKPLNPKPSTLNLGPINLGLTGNRER